MKANFPLSILAVFSLCIACNSEKGNIEADGSEATVASETGTAITLPADVIYVTKPLISGEVYRTASFKGASLTRFDTTQAIQVLDTSDAVFVRARIQQDTAAYTGFVSKAILPE
jgi:hypothetical protein